MSKNLFFPFFSVFNTKCKMLELIKTEVFPVEMLYFQWLVIKHTYLKSCILIFVKKKLQVPSFYRHELECMMVSTLTPKCLGTSAPKGKLWITESLMLTAESVVRKPSHIFFFSVTNPIFPNLYTIATFSIHLKSCSLNAIKVNVCLTQCCSATNPSNLQVSKTHSHFKWI